LGIDFHFIVDDLVVFEVVLERLIGIIVKGYEWMILNILLLLLIAWLFKLVW
jgi:hypothetical protein